MLETAEDRKEFFQTADFAVSCSLSGPGGTVTIPVLQNSITDNVSLYDTNIEAPGEHFTCRLEDLATIDRRQVKQYTATIGGVSYKLERIEKIEDGLIAAVYLKK